MNRYQLHPQQPQTRLIKQIVEQLHNGNIGAIPTDSGYALICRLGEAGAKKRIDQIRQLPKQHLHAILVHDVSQLSNYAVLSNENFRLIKQCTPGAFTFILPASREIPRKLQNKRKTIGIRIPDHQAPLCILAALNEPLISTSLTLPDTEITLFDADEVQQKLHKSIDFMVDCPPNHLLETTIIDCCQSPPQILRQGAAQLR